MALDAQVRLLRVIQHREVERLGGTDRIPIDIRIIAATNKDLAKMVHEGRFKKEKGAEDTEPDIPGVILDHLLTAQIDTSLFFAYAQLSENGNGYRGEFQEPEAFSPSAQYGGIEMNDYRLSVHLLIVLSLLLSCISLTDCNGNGGRSNSLSITLEGAGSGRVSSVPAGIHCENDCAEDYASDTDVVLSAQPYSGSVFTGWDGGGCSGTGTCSLSMTNDTTVTANFDLTAPAALSLVTPYASESDMSDINDFFNAQYRNEPWGRIHDGLDVDPDGDLKAYQSACAGRVNKIYTFDDQVMVMIDCDMTYSIGYNFECQAPDTGPTQFSNMLITEGQLVAQGETIGYLYSAENPAKAHVHVTLYQNAVPICPEPYFTQAARDSILNLIAVVHTDVIMCNSVDVMPPLFSAPYSSEAEMAKITAGFSSQYSLSPWDYVNDGIDIYPQDDLAGVQAACSGTVDAVQLQRRAADDTWQVEVSIACDEYVADPDDGGYFIPLTTKYALNTMSTIASEFGCKFISC